MQTSSKIILGIDPGTVVMGYGILQIDMGEMKMLEMDVCRFPQKLSSYQKLEQIHEIIHNLIGSFKPTQFAIEAPFYGKNVQSMLKLGRAQGVAIAAAIQAGLPVSEYAPKKVKQSITGNGNADKSQVMSMLQKILHFTEDPKYFDASDALAVAVCHYFQESSSDLHTSSSERSWKKFLAENPQRIKR